MALSETIEPEKVQQTRHGRHWEKLSGWESLVIVFLVFGVVCSIFVKNAVIYEVKHEMKNPPPRPAFLPWRTLITSPLIY
jgi:hypothetical protein